MDSTTVRLDLTGCKTLADIHRRIRVTFDFPDCYGSNWDAFYDFMCTEAAANHVIICGAYSLPADLRECIPAMGQALDYVKAERLLLNEIFNYEIIS